MKPSSSPSIAVSFNHFLKRRPLGPQGDNRPPTSSNNRLLGVLSSYIHPPLPLTPRQKGLLLNEITKSFRNHLAADRPFPPVEAVTPCSNTERDGPINCFADRHFARVLASPVLNSWGTTHTSVYQTRETATLVLRERLLKSKLTLESAKECLRSYVLGVLPSRTERASALLSHSRNDGALAALHHLQRHRLLSPLRPPTELGPLRNWLVAGLLLSSNPLVPFHWIAFHLSNHDHSEASILIWTIVQTYLRTISNQGAVEFFLWLIGFKGESQGAEPYHAKFDDPIVFECRRLLDSPSARDFRILYKVAREIFRKLDKDENARRKLAQAVNIWNPTPYDLALNAHLALTYCDDYGPGIKYLVSLRGLSSQENIFGQQDRSRESFLFRLILCLRIIKAIAVNDRLELVREMVGIINNRLLLSREDSTTREVLMHLGHENIALASQNLLQKLSKYSYPISDLNLL